MTQPGSYEHGRFDVSGTVGTDPYLRTFVLEATDTKEKLPDSFAERNAQVALMCAEIVPDDCAVVVPQKPITSGALKRNLAELGLTDRKLWVYGASFPDDLFLRSTKAQVHLPVSGDTVPSWYDHGLPAYLQETTVPGYSCFTPDAMEAASGRLLDEFPRIRFKDPNGFSGEDQVIVSSEQEFAEFEERLDSDLRSRLGFGLKDYLAKYGYVIEANLEREVKAWSLTVTRTPDEIYTSFGRIVESAAELPSGEVFQEYAGTSSVVVRGDPSSLLRLPEGGLDVYDPVRADEHIRLTPTPSIVNAALRHAEALHRWEEDGIYRSRTNVDILTGTLVRRDGSEELIAATVEDSARIGGASPAEILGITALRNNPDAPYVVRSTRHSYNHADAAEYAEMVARSADGRTFWHGFDQSKQDFVYCGVY